MAVVVNDLNSYAGITEYSWEGIVSQTDAMAVSIEAVHGHIQILQVGLHLDTTGAQADIFSATINHANGTSLDIEFFSQDMNTLDDVLQRWSNDAGIYVPKGSSVDFAYSNADDSGWGLSVLIRSE